MISGGVKRICVVGAGTMGHQIALTCALHDYQTNLTDVSKEALDKAKLKVQNTLEDKVKRKVVSTDQMQKALSNLNFFDDLREAARNVDFVIEAVFENVEVKRKVFKQLDNICPSHTILASNTSSIRPSLISTATKRGDRVVGMNFGNPIWEHPCAEIMGTKETSGKTIEIAKNVVRSLDVTPIHVKKEINGYAFNRVWRAVKRESLHLVDQGYISPEDLDRAFMINLGASIGPFMLMDIVGLDVILHVEEQYYRESQDEKDKPPQTLIEKVAKGQLGVKSGKGFYEYRGTERKT